MNESSETTAEKQLLDRATPELKERFFKSILSDTIFSLEEKLFDGTLKIEFRSLTVDEVNDIYTQLKRDEFQNLLTTDAAYVMRLTNYRLSTSIIKINDVPFLPEITKEAYKPENSEDSYLKARIKAMEKWSMFKLSIIAEAYKQFENLLILLTKEVNTPGFWKAAE